MMQTHPALTYMDNTVDTFSRNKAPGTYRIFCVGGSTTRGWPFHEVLSYPRLLSLYLHDLLPGKKIEVINAGFMACDSSCDVRIIKEIVQYQPDLILAYEGRTDDGNLPLYSSRFSWLLKVQVWLLKNVQGYGRIRNYLLPDRFDNAWGTRKLLGKTMPLDRQFMRTLFWNNLETIANIAQGHHCTLALFTQIVRSEEQGNIFYLNHLVKKFATTRGVLLVDTENAFAQSPLSEDDLVIPVSVHPNYRGYALMARTVCNALSRQDLIAPRQAWHWQNLKDDDYYSHALGMTDAFIAQVYTKHVLRIFDGLGMSAHRRYYQRIAEKLGHDRVVGVSGR